MSSELDLLVSRGCALCLRLTFRCVRPDYRQDLELGGRVDIEEADEASLAGTAFEGDGFRRDALRVHREVVSGHLQEFVVGEQNRAVLGEKCADFVVVEQPDVLGFFVRAVDLAVGVLIELDSCAVYGPFPGTVCLEVADDPVQLSVHKTACENLVGQDKLTSAVPGVVPKLPFVHKLFFGLVREDFVLRHVVPVVHLDAVALLDSEHPVSMVRVSQTVLVLAFAMLESIEELAFVRAAVDVLLHAFAVLLSVQELPLEAELVSLIFQLPLTVELARLELACVNQSTFELLPAFSFFLIVLEKTIVGFCKDAEKLFFDELSPAVFLVVLPFPFVVVAFLVLDLAFAVPHIFLPFAIIFEIRGEQLAFAVFLVRMVSRTFVIVLDELSLQFFGVA